MSQIAPEVFAADPFETAPDPAAHFAADGELLRANAAFRTAFRHPVGARRPPWGRITPPPFRGGVRRFDAPAPDGRLYEWVERRLLDGSRIAIARDVTERAHDAAEADRAKTLLFATLTHELRTPLNGILGMAGLMAQSRLDPEARDHLRAVQQSGEHLLDLINDILDYSRIEAGKLTLEDAPFDAEASAQSVAELLSPKARAKGLEIVVVRRRDVQTQVRGDEGRFRQILFNLAGNAVKFTEKGGVTIELARSAGGRLRLVVRDTGLGIAPETQAEIFEEFKQADESIARRYGGAGLGLAIVRRLAQAMGGAVGVDSAKGQGAAFWAELPLPTMAARDEPARLDGIRVAILTPSDVLARSLIAAVNGLSGVAMHVADGAALNGFDVLLLDHAPSLDAESIARHVAAGPTIIALVPQEEREAITLHREAGVAHYVIKPVRRHSLAERIRLAAGLSEAGRTALAAEDDRARTPSLGGLHVLLAEDNSINALLARTLLARAGCRVDVVHDGREAVAAAEATPYDLIFLDLRMPELDGLAAARRIRAGAGLSAKAPLIALTADAGEPDKRAARAAGMDDFITKPIDPLQLASVAARFTRAPKPGSLPPT